jgi:hypothetical protein
MHLGKIVIFNSFSLIYDSIILIEIFTRRIPYDGEVFDETRIIKGHRPTLPKELFEQNDCLKLHDLIVQCIDANPLRRPQFTSIDSQLQEIYDKFLISERKETIIDGNLDYSISKDCNTIPSKESQGSQNDNFLK